MTILTTSGQFYNFGPFWQFSIFSLTILNNFGPFWTIWIHLEPFFTILDHFYLFFHFCPFLTFFTIFPSSQRSVVGDTAEFRTSIAFRLPHLKIFLKFWAPPLLKLIPSLCFDPTVANSSLSVHEHSLSLFSLCWF